jgi:hypothetical protein
MKLAQELGFWQLRFEKPKLSTIFEAEAEETQ